MNKSILLPKPVSEECTDMEKNALLNTNWIEPKSEYSTDSDVK